MASLKEIRGRLATVASTRQITNAMKMVSAAKLRRAQQAIVQMRPYAEQLHMILTHLSDAIKDEEDDPYGVQRDLERILIVVITSNRGLCGSFNSFIIKRSIQIATEEYASLFKQNMVDFYSIGKRGDDFLRKNHYNIIFSKSELYYGLSFEKVMPESEEIM